MVVNARGGTSPGAVHAASRNAQRG